jgi:magnesium transporter
VVFDHYKYIISRIGERIELLEEKLLKNFQDASLEEIKDLKMEVLYFHRSIFPCRELVAEFMKIDSEICDDEIYVHLKELRDNLNQCIETTENYREILSDQLNIYHTTVSSHLNDIMKFMTVFSAIFIPLSLIAGIYGTNFEHVPELHMRYGYYFMWVIMIAVAIVMTLVFKRKKWL